MKRIPAFIVCMMMLALAARAEVMVKLRDISYVDGLKENQLMGFGIVVGLPGTGDTRSALTKTSLRNLLKNMGIEGDDIGSKNTAAVMVTATLPAFARVGDRVDITVSSIGDAKSLEGGILVQSPLRGADDRVYVAAQGTLSMDGAGAPGGRTKTVKTVGSISGGGIVERESLPEYGADSAIQVVLENWDFTMASRIVKALNDAFPESKAAIAKGGKIKLVVPKETSVDEFIAKIEAIEVPASARARVVVDERSGTIVMGGAVRISEVVVSKEGMTVRIEKKDKGSAGTTSVAHIKDVATVKDLVDALGSIGASTRDIIAILKAMDEAKALHAELIIR